MEAPAAECSVLARTVAAAPQRLIVDPVSGEEVVAPEIQAAVTGTQTSEADMAGLTALQAPAAVEGEEGVPEPVAPVAA